MVDALILALAAVAAAASLVVVLKTDVMHSALALITVLLCLAGIYAGLGAWFIAAVQAVVYAGAVMVLFLFAIMVLESRREHPARLAGRRLTAAGAGLAGLGLFAALLASARGTAPVSTVPGPSLAAIAHGLFGEGLLPFELVGVLLLVALVAVVVLAGRPQDAADGGPAA